MNKVLKALRNVSMTVYEEKYCFIYIVPYHIPASLLWLNSYCVPHYPNINNLLTTMDNSSAPERTTVNLSDIEVAYILRMSNAGASQTAISAQIDRSHSAVVNTIKNYDIKTFTGVAPHLETPKFSLNANPGPFYTSLKRIVAEPLKISPTSSLISSPNIRYSVASLSSVSRSTSLSKSPSSPMIISVNDWNFVRNVRTRQLMIGGGLFGQMNARLKLASKLE